ncbi:hypothetical protein ACFO4E_01395 [Nocardiopsis mangrovi]|uniref:Uncharacterized protein n=1 Tax=Nocardiopsis mangrovi TaxID=1179818 RepID=A0ABV9DPY0_9ACTN
MSGPTDLDLAIVTALETVGMIGRDTTVTEREITLTLKDGTVIAFPPDHLPAFLAGACSEYHRTHGEHHPLTHLLEETGAADTSRRW